jgi:hypothetical protein
MFSKYRSDHVHHLKQIFNRCKKYAISLNPKKNIFTLIEGKILDFIFSKLGIVIEPERIKEIS